MSSRWKFSLVIEGVKNISARTKNMALFWLIVIALAELAIAVFGGGIWLAIMLGATVVVILAMEIGQDITRYINNIPQPPEESLQQAVAGNVPEAVVTLGFSNSREGTAPDTPVIGSEVDVTLAGETAAEISDDVVAGAVETAADAVGETVAGVIGEIISGS